MAGVGGIFQEKQPQDVRDESGLGIFLKIGIGSLNFVQEI